MTWLGLLVWTLSPAEAGRKQKKTEEPVTLPCAWSVGDRWSYSYVRARVDSRNPALAGVSTTTEVTIEALDTEGDRTVFGYAAGTPRVDGPPEVVAAVAETLGSTPLPAMEIVMEGGRLVDVRNLEELVDAIEPILLRSLPADADPKAVEMAMRPFRDPATAPAMLLAEPAKLFALHCSAMAPGESRGGPSTSPNPFGGPPLTAQSKVWVTGWDPKAGTLSMATDDRTDPGAIQALVEGVLAQIAPEAIDAERAAALRQLPPIGSVMTGEMVYSTRDGFPLSVKVETVVGDPAIGVHRSDSMIWTQNR